MCNGKITMEIKQDCNIELPPGFRFHPTDDELVSFYLTRKIKNPHFAVKSIPNVSLNKCEPWDLPEKAKVGEKEWYFFSLRDRKYPTGIRTNRATEKGYWKATGKDRDVMNCSTHLLVGMKKTLVFYLGRAPKGEKTNWIMHEYRMENDLSNHLSNHDIHQSKNHEWVVCRVFQKMVGNKKPNFMYDGMPSIQLADSHDALPGDHLDNSPNPTVTDSGDCDTCTAAESCYNCQDSLREAGDYVTQEFRQGNATSVVARQLLAHTPIPMATPAMDVYHYNTMREPHYNHQNGNDMVKLFSPPPQSMIGHPLNSVTGNRMRAKLEPLHNPYSEGEDEVESSQRVNNLDYAWPDDALNEEYFPCDGSLLPLQSVVEDSSQTSTCFTDGSVLYNRTLRGSFSGLSEVGGPAMDVLQEWSY